ncbi:MAG: DUF4349 domain-containing protein [Leptospirales bacterium]|nr:DUF4349 domain-containing protein [Leptospirales bacterium]
MKLARQSLIGAAALFGILFVINLAYAYSQPRTTSNAVLQTESFEFGRKNYASEKKQMGNIAAAESQKYEKVATLSARSEQFENDEKRVRQIIKDFRAVIQFEQSSGLPGKRVIHLGIGVHPDQFDAMVLAARELGKLLSINVNKTDKTNEYKDIQAKRISLEKVRAGLMSLKGRNGKIEELIALEQKILEIEKEIQAMGVKLGEFDSENEFCTVKISLYESESTGGSMGRLFSNVIDALKSATLWSMGIAFFYLFCIAGFFFSIKVLERGREIFLKLKGQS